MHAEFEIAESGTFAQVIAAKASSNQDMDAEETLDRAIRHAKNNVLAYTNKKQEESYSYELVIGKQWRSLFKVVTGANGVFSWNVGIPFTRASVRIPSSGSL